MRKIKFISACMFLLIALSVHCKNYTDNDATIAIDAFHEAFYNPDMKLYAVSSDKKGRAAIWVQATYWDMIMNAYKRTKSHRYRQLIEDIYQGGREQYAHYDWNSAVEWFIYDDMMWWIISLGRAYNLTHEPKFLANAVIGFNHVWEGSYDAKRGGMWWNFEHGSKNACITYPTTVGAMTLYIATGDSDYLAKAKEIYAWSRNVFFDNNTGAVFDNLHYHIHQPNGYEIDHMTLLYNQATCIGAATMLYKATNNKQYLDDAVKAADYVKSSLCNSNGILPFKNGVEQGIYGAIFAEYIIMLIEDGHQGQYVDWLRNNINIAWSNKDNRNLTFKNASIPCPTGIMESYDVSTFPALMQVIKP